MKIKILLLILFLFSWLANAQSVYINGSSSSSVNDTEVYSANWDFPPDEGEFNWWVDGGDIIYPDVNWYSLTSCRVTWSAGGIGVVWYSYYTWDNWWEESFEVYVDSPTPLPDAPTINNESNITATSFTLSWSSVASATSYQLEVSTDPTSWGTLAYHKSYTEATSDNATGLSGGTTYYYRVRAVNAAGSSGYAGGDVLTLPATPMAYNATNITANSFTANWSTVTPNTDHYLLDVSTDNSFSSIVPGYNSLPINANQTSQNVSGLSPGTNYYFRVRAENDGLQSEYSNNKSVLTIPTVTGGPTAVCVNTAGHVYTTQTGMTGYSWSASGGTITSGQGTSSATVTWNTLGSQSVSVHYTNANGSSSVTPGTRSVTVNPRPTPSITSGPIVVCANTEGHVYTTQSDMTGYSWTATGGTVTAGQGTSSATVTWNTSGSQSVSVNYTNGNSCSSATPGVLPVTVNPGSSPSITDGPSAVCVNTGGHVYTTQTGMTEYSWVVSGGTVTAGEGTSSATVLWNSSAWDISVHYTNEYGCSSTIPGTMSVTANPRPIPSITEGPTSVCVNTGGHVYTTQTGMTEYSWSAPGGTITAGQGTSSATVTWNTSGSRSLSVTYKNEYGCSAVTPGTRSVMVNPQSNGGTLGTAVEVYGPASGTLSVTGITGAIQKWQQKIGSGTWTDIAQTSSTLSYSNITTTTSYQVIVQSGVCVSSTSNAVSITIYPVPTLTIVGSNAIAPGGGTQIVASSGFDSYRWYRDGSSMTGATASTLNVTKPGSYKVSVKATSTSPTYTTAEIIIESTLDQQLASVNYIVSTSFMKKGVTEQTDMYDLRSSDFSEVIQYFDGLGRQIQTVSLGNSPAGNDVVLPVVYDGFGREAIKYLPYSRDVRDGRYVVSPLAEQFSFYQSDDHVAHDAIPSAETIFEASPLNRVLKQGAPGAAWQPNSTPYSTATDNSIKYAHQTNLGDEVLLWTYTLPTPAFPLGLLNAGTAAEPIYYNANELHKTSTKDEHQHEVIQFVDKQGRSILKKVQGPDNTWALTYYIYDDSGQLVCVIPPEAVSRLALEYYHAGSNDGTKNTFLERWAFRYRYDGRKRMTIKQVPGADSIVMVYDERDRLVFTQDGNQRNANEWLLTKYDGLNRPVMTGIYTHGSDIDSKTMAGLLSTTTISEVYDGSTSNYGYSNAVFPTGNCEVLTVNYYDDYGFKSLMNDANGNFSYANSEVAAVPASPGQDELPGQDEFAFDRVKGQVTGSQTRILNSSTFLWTANYYDDHYRLIQTTRSNHKGGFDRVTNVHDFVGKVVRTKTRYAIPPNADREIYQRFSYDHAKRLLNTWHRIEGGPEVLIFSNEYNEIGQLITKKLHYNDSPPGEFLQTIDYRYNIRGWLENINDPSDPAAEDLFNMELKYNLPTAKGGAEQFNGNISEAIWKSAGLDKQSYGYEYDPMNRMTEALYYNIVKPADDGHYDERIGKHNESQPEQSLPGYDLNGNILNLLRNEKKDAGVSGLMDELHYDYTNSGNRLNYVSDNIATNEAEEGFKELSIGEGTTDYAYDYNGNLTKDENKGIVNIEYNHLNLPWKVSKSPTEYLIYTYDATGKKLAQQVFGTSPKITDYVGELVLEDNTLQFILHAEGRIVADTEPGAPDPWEYQYFLKDHLGNTRVVFSEKTSSEVYTATMEDGEVSDEMADFSHYPTARSGVNEFDHTDEGSVYTRSMVLHGGENNQIGLAKSFEVNPGDVFDLEVYAKYQAPSENPSDLDGLFSQVVSAFSLGSNTTPLDGAAALSAFENLFQGGAPWINSSIWDPAPPKAYLNYLLFDENFILVDFGFDQVSADCEQAGLDPIVPHDHLSLHVKVEQKGFLYVYLSNEQPEVVTDVYFDDMKIVHYSAVEQVSDYYPFGLTFNSYQRESSVDQKFKFQGQEHIDDLDLGWDSFKWRNHQPDIGRFFNVDPLAEDYYYNSPYAFSENKVTSHVELEGLESQTIHEEALNKEVKQIENVVMSFVEDIKDIVEYVMSEPSKQHPEEIEEVRSVDEEQTGPQSTDTKWIGSEPPQFNPDAVGQNGRGDKVLVTEGGQTKTENGKSRNEVSLQDVENTGNAKSKTEGDTILTGRGMKSFKHNYTELTYYSEIVVDGDTSMMPVKTIKR